MDVDENTLTIKKEYLATLPVGDAELSVVFNEGAPVPLTITILPENAEIGPASGPFDPAEPEDVTATITLHDAGGVKAVKAGGVPLAVGVDYDHEGLGGGEVRLIIMQGYLTAQDAGKLVLTVEFEKGASAELTITIIPEAATGTITGTVKDSSNNPVLGANVRLTLSGSVYSATTIEGGSYSMPNVPAGTGYTVTAGKSGYTGGSVKNVSVAKNTTTQNINITLTPNEAGCVVTYQDAQLRQNEDGSYDIHFIATTNTLNAQEVGFVFSKTQEMPAVGGEKVSVKSANKVYSTVTAGDSTFEAASYGETYIFVCTVTEIPQTDDAMNTSLYVRAFSTIGGVTKYTVPVTVTVHNLP